MTGPAKPRRWLRNGTLLFALALTVTGGWLLWSWTSTRREVTALLAELDRVDPGWRLDGILAGRKAVRDEDNSALAIAKAAALMPRFSVGSPAVDQAGDEWMLPQPWPPKLRALVAAEMPKIPPASLALVRQLKDMPEGRFALKIDPTFTFSLVPHLDATNLVFDWLEYDAYLRADQDSVDAALESCLALLNASRATAGEPFSISHLVRSGGHRRMLIATERVLSQGQASAESLRLLQNQVKKETFESEIVTGLRGERAGNVQCYEHLESTNASYRTFMNTQVGPLAPAATFRDKLLDWLPHRTTSYIVDQVRVSTRLIETAKLPLHEQADGLKPVLAEIKSKQMPLITLPFAQAEKLFRCHRRSQSHLRAIEVALACERFRMQHKTWPDSLENVVAAKLLDAVPLDPNDGQPLRYRRTAWGVVIYGVGDDRADNEGNVLHEWHEPAGTDLGIRLWDLPRRKGGTP
jgi:hypothetical protein